MQFLDSHGWPVVTFKGRPITNLIRRISHTRKIKLGTWKQTHDRSDDSNQVHCYVGPPKVDKSVDCGCRNYDPRFGCSNCDAR